ncbi:MAG: hypothetical protein HY301_13565 [Verrucomicrobia bacterium]|nr:hypothetical protein [Verrucomicrobiota bacterium]
MRTKPLMIVLVACVVAVSCSRSGDFGSFVIREVATYGGHTVTNGPFPRLDAHWTFKPDKNGFQTTITGTSFTNLDNFLKQAYGSPKLSKDGTSSGRSSRVWAAATAGAVITITSRPDGADLICVRGMPFEEMLGEMEKPWWKKLRLWW